ncbi:MAG: hypothetical protein HZB43_02530 [candidate division Zixibacteria bacterium]|nr:hypothetical protein [candidate division Zixibacteria bacterium]
MPASPPSPVPDCASCFLYAGASALLLLLAHASNCWYLSFVALIPFLYKSNRSNEAIGLKLGFFMGLSFLTVSGIDTLVTTPWIALLRISIGTALFSLFGWTLARVRHHWGFQPVLAALLWVALEAGLMQTGFDNGLFAETELSLSVPMWHSIATLFGCLIVALIIVLINSLLLAALETAVAIVRARGHLTTEGKSNWDLILSPGLVTQSLRLVSEERGPPPTAIQQL